jgi:flagellar basal-body rod protein FlgF
MSSYGIWLSAAGMKVSDHRQTVLANNLANAHTPGFKHDLAVVMQRRIESESIADGFQYAHPVLDGLAGGVNVRPTHHTFAQGPIERTDNPLDVAIKGDGFFAVSDGSVTRYTRDGRFSVNTPGELVLAAGEGRWKVLDDAEGPIVLDPAGGKVRVSGNGTIRQGQTAVATLGIMTTDDKQSLRKVGANLFEAKGEMVPAEANLVTESLEGSTFDVMQGLAELIEATRAFQLNAKMVQLQDQVTGQAVTTVGRVA